MDDYEVCSAIHRDIEQYNDDFDDIIDCFLDTDEAGYLNNEVREGIVAIQLMLADFVERIYNLQRELSRAQRTGREPLIPHNIYYSNYQARLDALCQEFEVKATVLYNFREQIAAAPRTQLGAVEISASSWEVLIRELQQGVSKEYLIFSRR
ncbi:hypothetical protein CIB48_g9075 [Xylaria polymorpha]|nr:hypothetical protein CIB48_g9075 [Xylaria polymorpha]